MNKWPLLAVLLIAGPVQAANDQQIKASMAAAVDYLKKVERKYDNVGAQEHEEGPMALAGIALLEAGVPVDDPVIQAMAKAIRQKAIVQTKTYQLALDILFLDKTGEDVDTALVQSMGARLLVGQYANGGWTYICPGADEREQRRLAAAIQGATLTGGNGAAATPINPDAPVNRPRLAPEVEDILKTKRFAFPPSQGPNSVPLADDNSNTQFAVLALWAARRHGLAVEHALSLTEKRFRATQTANGGWVYSVSSPGPSASMTCAGLLALGIGIGNSGERSMRAARINPDGTIKAAPKDPTKPIIKNPMQDRQVQNGFAFLGQTYAAAGTPAGNPAPGGNYYFLWSLERVCMVYGVTTIGNKDWHYWGADILVRSQANNGSWGGGSGPEVNTSFALMFLSRANLVKDLSHLLGNRALRASTDTGFKPSTETRPSSGAPASNSPATTGADDDPKKLAAALVVATGAKQTDLLKQYTDAKGSAFTQALAEAIPQLSGDAQKRAREALADRLSNFSARTLRTRLSDDHGEIRRAAAIAAAMREEKELIPDLIGALSDREELVVRGARVALKSFSGQDFGPPPGFTEAQRAQAIAEWREWFKKQPE